MILNDSNQQHTTKEKNIYEYINSTCQTTYILENVHSMFPIYSNYIAYGYIMIRGRNRKFIVYYIRKICSFPFCHSGHNAIVITARTCNMVQPQMRMFPSIYSIRKYFSCTVYFSLSVINYF